MQCGSYPAGLAAFLAPRFWPIYHLHRTDVPLYQESSENMLSKEFIQLLLLLCRAPALFLPKLFCKLRLSKNYRELSGEIFKNCYPQPLIEETMGKVLEDHIYTKPDVCESCSIIRIAEGDKWTMTFRSNYALFKSVVMLFGLTNEPPSFQGFLCETQLRTFLDILCMIYLDDILIYRDNLKEYK